MKKVYIHSFTFLLFCVNMTYHADNFPRYNITLILTPAKLINMSSSAVRRLNYSCSSYIFPPDLHF